VALRSLRARFLLLLGAGVLAPLALLGLWLTQVGSRSGETLLQERLDSATASAARELGVRWTRHRSGLLDVAEHPAVRHWLSQQAHDPPAIELSELAPELPEAVADRQLVVIRDAWLVPRWTLEPGDSLNPSPLVPDGDTLSLQPPDQN
jgi:hypothetical protein